MYIPRKDYVMHRQINILVSLVVLVSLTSSVYSEHRSRRYHDDEANDENEANEVRTYLAAHLINSVTTAAAFVNYTTETSGTIVENEFRVHVARQAANAQLDVVVGGVTVGQVATDTNGEGRLEFVTTPDDTDDLAFPANFPAIVAGTIVAVGVELSGPMAVPTLNSHGDVDDDSILTDATRLTTSLTTSTSSATAWVSYITGTSNGVVFSEFEVHTSRQAANVTLDVTVGNVKVGQITTDSYGHGHLEMATTPSNIYELPFPANFPAVTVGTAVTVGANLTGTLALAITRNGEGHHGKQAYHGRGGIRNRHFRD